MQVFAYNFVSLGSSLCDPTRQLFHVERIPANIVQRKYVARSERVIFFDGQRATMYLPQQKFYSTVDFVGNLDALVSRLEARYGVEIPSDVERFFEAAEGGKWDEIESAFQPIMQQRKAGSRDDLNVVWGPILETYGVAESTHLWPAQKLLDYGNGILDSLRPGMIYVGGTDAGRWI